MTPQQQFKELLKDLGDDHRKIAGITGHTPASIFQMLKPSKPLPRWCLYTLSVYRRLSERIPLSTEPDKTLEEDLNCMNLTEIEKEVIQDHFKKLTQDIEYYMNVKENIIIDKLAKFRLNGH